MVPSVDTFPNKGAKPIHGDGGVRKFLKVDLESGLRHSRPGDVCLAHGTRKPVIAQDSIGARSRDRFPP